MDKRDRDITVRCGVRSFSGSYKHVGNKHHSKVEAENIVTLKFVKIYTGVNLTPLAKQYYIIY